MGLVGSPAEQAINSDGTLQFQWRRPLSTEMSLEKNKTLNDSTIFDSKALTSMLLLDRLWLSNFHNSQTAFMAAHTVTGACRCDRITPILQDLHWLPNSQRVVSKRLWWSGSVSKLLLCIPAMTTSGSQKCTLHPIKSHCFHASRQQRSAKFCCQWTDHLEQSAACTMSTRAVTQHFHTCTNRHLFSSARHCWNVLRDSDTEYKHTDLLTYLLK